MSELFFAGIDPGLSGALAVLQTRDFFDRPISPPELAHVQHVDVLSVKTSTGKTRNELDIATMNRLMRGMASGERVTCAIEQVNAMPGQGVTSMFRFGQVYGQLHALVVCSGWSVHHVTPQRWKADLRLGKGKDEARKRAMELWPQQAGLFARAKDDGRAEAALIAYWLWRNQTAKLSP